MINLSGVNSPRLTANEEKQTHMNSIRSIAILGLLMLTSYSFAIEDAPPAPESSPNSYEVLAENEQFRVIEAIWQPGQEDYFHSHPGDRISLYQTNCNLQLTNLDGTNRVGNSKAGMVKARTGKLVKLHKVKNQGYQVSSIRIMEWK